MPTKQKNKLLNTILSLVISIIATFLLVSIASTLYATVTLQKQAEFVRSELKKLESEKNELTAIKTKLEDKDYVVTYARGEYMFSKGDEKLFKLPSKE